MAFLYIDDKDDDDEVDVNVNVNVEDNDDRYRRDLFYSVSKYRRLCVLLFVLILAIIHSQNLKFSRWIFWQKDFPMLFFCLWLRLSSWANRIHLSEWRKGTKRKANWVSCDKKKNVERRGMNDGETNEWSNVHKTQGFISGSRIMFSGCWNFSVVVAILVGVMMVVVVLLLPWSIDIWITCFSFNFFLVSDLSWIFIVSLFSTLYEVKGKYSAWHQVEIFWYFCRKSLGFFFGARFLSFI